MIEPRAIIWEQGEYPTFIQGDHGFFIDGPYKDDEPWRLFEWNPVTEEYDERGDFTSLDEAKDAAELLMPGLVRLSILGRP